MNRVMATSVTAILASFCGTPGAHGQVRDIKITDAAGSNHIVSAPWTPSTLFVTATFEGMKPPAIEFRISGLPYEWIVSAGPSSAVNFSVGSVLHDGVNLSLSCEPGAASATLFELTVSPRGLGRVELSVMPHQFPWNGVSCPKFAPGLCEAPGDAFVCLPVGPRAVLDVIADGAYCDGFVAGDSPFPVEAPYWAGESFGACSTGDVGSVVVFVEPSVVSPEGQLARMVLRAGLPTGDPGQVEEVKLFPGYNRLRFASPRPVVEGGGYFFAIGSDQRFSWANHYYGLSPTTPAALGSFVTDWTTTRLIHDFEFPFVVQIVPSTDLRPMTWGNLKTKYR